MALTITGPFVFSGSFQCGGNALTVPEQVVGVSPANTETHVSYLPTISWQNGGGALTYQVFFDTSNPPTTSVQNSADTSYEPAALSFSTVYYLKINSINNSGTTTGTVYSFTTEPVFDVDAYSSLNVGGADGDALSTGKLDDGTEVSIGTWSLTANAGSYAFVSAALANLHSPVRNDVTIYTGQSATRAIKFRMDQYSNEARLTLTTPVAALSVGFFIKIGPIAASDPAILDLVNVTNAEGGYSVLQISNAGLLRIHSETNGGSQYSAGIAGTGANNIYWCTMDCAEHGTEGATDTLKVYTTAGVLLGTASIDTSAATDKASNYTIIRLGRSDAHSGGTQPASTSYVQYAHLVADVTDQTFPLGP